MRVMVLGATGTIGRAVAVAAVKAGHDVVCVTRTPRSDVAPGAVNVVADVTAPDDIRRAFQTHGPVDAVISCLASRTGAPGDAWAIDHDAHQTILAEAQRAGVGHFALLSALCVQKPRLAFQQAKLAFERDLINSGLTYSIVRPTAFFKSLSGQVARVQDGKPFLVFGDGQLTACKPISDRDLATYIVGCLTDPARQNQVLPIGGPGPALTPLDQVAALERVLGHPVPVRRVPLALMPAIVGGLSLAGRFSARAAAKADLARIGRYYATESMLVWDAEQGRYDADATPEFGQDRLEDFYGQLVSGAARVDLGDHAVF